jgi:hypothetical protein
LLEQFFAGGVHQSEHSAGVEGKQGSIDFFHDSPQQRSRFDRAYSLIRKQVGQSVDLKRKLTQRVLRSSSTGSKGIVFLAQGGNYIG